MKKAPITYHVFHDLYGLLFVVNFMGILFFGLYPGIKALKEKRAFLKDVSSKNEEFSTLLETADKKEVLYDEIRPYLSDLYLKVPEDFYGDRLVEDFLFLSARYNYFLSSLAFHNREDTHTEVNIALRGEFERLEEFLKALEKERLAVTVKSIRVTFDQKGRGDRDQVILDLRLYNSSRKDN